MKGSPTVSGYAPSGDAKLYFEACGNGSPLVFIHAGVADRRMWDPQVEAFSSRFRVVRYDLRGFGQSALPEESFAHRDDLLAVLRHLHIEKASLVGCSMGGSTAIDFTLEHPQMVSALVPVGSGLSGWNDWSVESTELMKGLTKAVKERDVDAAFELSARYWIDGPSREASRVDDAYRKGARRLHKENFSLKLFLQNEVPLNPPAVNRLREIKCPTMVMIGDCDAQDLCKIAQYLAREISGAMMTTIENAAHLPSLEHPAQFNSLLENFFKSTDHIVV